MASHLSPDIQEGIFPTRWTSTDPKGDPKGRTYMYKAVDDQPPPPMGQRVTGVSDGVEVSVPHAPYEKWIKKCGTVACVPMYTARMVEPGVNWRDDKYYSEIRREMLRASAVHYETGEHYDAKTRKLVEPDRAEWLAGREKLIADRQQRQSAFREAVDKKWMQEKEAKMAELGESFVSMMKAATDRAANAAGEPKKGR
jgi:hypothetical protein